VQQLRAVHDVAIGRDLALDTLDAAVDELQRTVEVAAMHLDQRQAVVLEDLEVRALDGVVLHARERAGVVGPLEGGVVVARLEEPRVQHRDRVAARHVHARQGIEPAQLVVDPLVLDRPAKRDQRARRLGAEVTVVDAQHQPAATSSLRQRAARTREQLRPASETVARRRQQRRERSQRDRRRRPRRPHPLHPAIPQLCDPRELDGQPRLADPRRPGDDHAARRAVGEQPAGESKLTVTPHQRPLHAHGLINDGGP
jgi:hypothetical protein